MPTTRTLLLLAFTGAAALGQQPALSPERLQTLLRRFPAADTNKDGTLSLDEARAHARTLRQARPGSGSANPEDATPATAAPAPTFADVSYGPHERNVLDFWKAKSDGPAPLVVFIHGGGFKAGDKSKVRQERTVQEYLDRGVSFAAINYRYRTTAPMQEVLRDCARAIQYLRAKASEWNVDKARVAAYGGSAGAGTSLWLAFHGDLADPQNPDPVLRESSRLSCAGSNAGQFSYDILQWPTLFGEDVARRFAEPGENWPGFYGLKTDEELRSPAGQKLRADCDMLGLISKDDPPVFLSASARGGEITNRGQYLHHPRHSQVIYERCREVGVPAIADIPALGLKPPADGPATLRNFLCKHLGAPPGGGETGGAVTR